MAKSIIESLSKPIDDQKYKTVFTEFPRRNVADALQISTSYLTNVLNGFSRPSAALEKRMNDLVEQIKAEQAKAKKK